MAGLAVLVMVVALGPGVDSVAYGQLLTGQFIGDANA